MSHRFTSALAAAVLGIVVPSAHAAVIGSQYRDAVLTLDPIGYWEFEGDGDLMDSSGNGNHATNTLPAVTGQFGAHPALGNSYTMPGGSNANYKVDNPGDSGDFSIALWFQGGTRDRALITKGTYSRTIDPHFAWDLFTKNNNTVHFKGGDGDASPNSNFLWDFEAPIPVTDDWIFVVATWDGTTDADGVKIYVNGELAGSATATSTDLATDFGLGIGGRNGTNGSPTRNWNGGLDEVALFDYALTGDEIANLYTLAAIPEPASLVLMGLGAALVLCRRR